MKPGQRVGPFVVEFVPTHDSEDCKRQLLPTADIPDGTQLRCDCGRLWQFYAWPAREAGWWHVDASGNNVVAVAPPLRMVEGDTDG